MSTNDLLNEWQLYDGAPESAIRDEIVKIGHSLPSDYVSFLNKHNGGEGFVDNDYLIIWKIEELSIFNLEYEVGKYAPGIFLFGSSGGGEAYGFDMRDPSMPIVRIPFIGMELQYAIPVARTFSELMKINHVAE